MKVLVTGATGYIGTRLISYLLDKGHEVVCCLRDQQRYKGYINERTSFNEIDFLNVNPQDKLPEDIDVAYFLVHSMAGSTSEFEKQELEIADNFKRLLQSTGVKQVIYLSGISNSEDLSVHLRSRRKVEDTLKSKHYALTILRAAIIVGSGSASFEIIRDLVEKLPIMVTPKWLKTRCQPISVRDVMLYLDGVAMKPQYYNKDFDIGGPDILTYKEMLLNFAKARGLIRKIFTLPIMTPRLSSYWLYFVTSTSYKLAVNLVDSMKIEVLCRPNNLAKELNMNPINYNEAIKNAFDKIDQNMVLSSWKDALSSGVDDRDLSRHVEVPSHGCVFDHKSISINPDLKSEITRKIWVIGGKNGWYYGNFLWKIRGYLDKLIGGVGLRRGRRSPSELKPGDALDFWRVLLADQEKCRLLLFAEMKLPGEAWLEFSIENDRLHQKATFRPKGLAGRLYWQLTKPFHYFIFNGMLKEITKPKQISS
ncbi:MAG: SDR family oxidoreductase [Flavobacteriales bacterium]|nr:SDR family oxidoreductase [Flavobacteriales bacterium]